MDLVPTAITPIARHAAGSLDDRDRAELQQAVALLLGQRGSLIRPAAWFGRRVHSAGRILSEINAVLLGDDATKRSSLLEAALHTAYRIGIAGLDSAREGRRAHHRQARWLAAASGGAGGLVGAAGIVADLPVTTCMMMRSIASIARSHGEDITSESTRLACLEVFALGTPAEGERDADMAYWATRAAFTHGSIQLLIRQVTARFGIVLAQKYLAQAVPLLGAAAGSTLNYLFMQHYQRMAEVHFMVRAVERRRDPLAVRACFEAMLDAARAGRGLAASSTAMPAPA
jgi:hypothetical protein